MTLFQNLSASMESEAIAEGWPTPTQPVAPRRTATGWEVLWLPPTFSLGEYAKVEIVADQAGVPCVGYWSAMYEGEEAVFSDGAVTDNSVFEGGPNVSDGTHTPDWVAPRHGHLVLTGTDAYLNGVGPGLDTATVGTMFRGNQFVVTSNCNMLIPGTTTVFGTISFNHRFTRDGMNILPVRTITGSAVSTSVFAPELPIMGVDKMQIGSVVTTIEPFTGTGSVDGDNLGPITDAIFWNSARAGLKAHYSLPWGTPGHPSIGWSEAVNKQAYLQRRDASLGHSLKLYVSERSKDVATALASGSASALYQLEKVAS